MLHHTVQSDALGPTPQTMRAAMSAFPTGVVLVAAEVDGMPTGMLANSFTSVSLGPPLVSLNFAKNSSTWPLLKQARRLGISILAEQQDSEFRQLSRKTAERFTGVEWFSSGAGSVLLAGASATFTVTRKAEIDAGDHVVTLLREDDLHRLPDRPPLSASPIWDKCSA